MGYKRAGFEVIGNVEIDPKMNDLYITNNHPKYNFCEDLRNFNEREDIPEELFEIDILDGSPPCTSFSIAGKREQTWGKEKKFREGQTAQKLDDLFFVFLDTVEKLRPKTVISENVVGITAGKAKGYCSLIIQRFKELGYDVQMFRLNAALMDVPQARERIFFIANRMGYPKLNLKFNHDPIPFKDVRSEHGKEPGENAKQTKALLMKAKPGDKKLENTIKRLTGESGKRFSNMIVEDNQVCPTITSGGEYYRLCDRTLFTDEDYRNVQSFPQDYNFKKQNVHYVTGMSVPPNMMANIATEVYEQWLKSK